MVQPGNWNIGPINLPDFGITEALFGPQFGNTSSTQTTGSSAPLQYDTPLNQALQQGGVLGATNYTNYGGYQQYSSPIGPQNQTSSSTQQSSGGGDSRLQQLQKTNRNPPQESEYQALLAQLQASQGPSQAEINNAYAGTLDVLNQAESNLRGQLPGLISEAEAQAAASRSLLEGQRSTANEQLGQQQQQSDQLAANQTAQQRQILQELTQANQARFGGASSAGQAASELQGREFQRNRGQIQQQAAQALTTINNERNRVEREFQQGLQQLEVNKQQAVNEINRMFQDKLLEINSRRAETESAKAQARISALQELRNQAFQIQVAEAQYKSQLQLQAQQNMSQLSSVEQTYLGALQSGQGAVSQQSSNVPTAIPGVSSSTQNTTTNPYVGQITNKEDQYTGQILPSSINDRIQLGVA